ncbi:MAG: alpha/beta hydrolase [Phycisphaerales bacterium]
MPSAKIGGRDIHHEIEGRGDPLLLIAGFGCDRTIWSFVRPALAERFRVITFDNRGMGRSSGGDAPFSIRDLADDAAALLDAIGLDGASPTVHVAGHSMGGLIAQELALARPRQVRSLMLLSCGTRIDERGRTIISSWGELARLVEPATAVRLAAPWIYTRAFFARPGALDGLIRSVVESPFPPTPEALLHQSRAVCACDIGDRAGAIGSPTLVLVGRDDLLSTLAQSEALARTIEGAELVVLDGTAHGLLVESPDAVSGAMLEFLARVAAGRSGAQ